MSEQRYTWYSDEDYNAMRPVLVPWLGAEFASSSFMHHRAGRRSYSAFDAWRDDLRKGWHVVPDGVRHVAVKGWPPGQRGLCGWWDFQRHAEYWAADRSHPRYTDTFADGPAIAEHRHKWCVLDLHDLADKREAAPRGEVTTTTWEDVRPTAHAPTPRELRERAEHRWSPLVLERWHGCACGAECSDALMGALNPMVAGAECNKAFQAYRRSRLPIAGPHADGSYTYANGTSAPTAPRFIVKHASEMREGEPFIDAGHAQACDPQATIYNSHPGNRSVYGTFRHGVSEAYIIDTASQEWRAFQAKQGQTRLEHELSKPGQRVTIVMGDTFMNESPRARAKRMRREMENVPATGAIKGERYEAICTDEMADHPRPTDAEIVEAWESTMRACEGNAHPRDIRVTPKGTQAVVSWAEYRAARSRELKRKQEEAREKERQAVVCEGTLAEDY